MEDALLEKELDEYYKIAADNAKLGSGRKFFAYGAKILTGLLGLVIAAGFFPGLDQYLGFAILVIVFFDGVFSNHLLLIAESEAGHAYAALNRRVKAKYNRESGTLRQRAHNGDEAAERELHDLMLWCHTELSEGHDAIQTSLAEADLKALKALSVEETKAKP